MPVFPRTSSSHAPSHTWPASPPTPPPPPPLPHLKRSFSLYCPVLFTYRYYSHSTTQRGATASSHPVTVNTQTHTHTLNLTLQQSQLQLPNTPSQHEPPLHPASWTRTQHSIMAVAPRSSARTHARRGDTEAAIAARRSPLCGVHRTRKRLRPPRTPTHVTSCCR